MGSDLQTLADRLEGLSGADRDMDNLIWRTFAPGKDVELIERQIAAARFRGREYGWDWPPYTASLDAVVKLVERTMAGKIGPITLLIAGSAQAILQSGDPCGWLVQVVAPTAPLALLRALVAAKIEEGK